MTAQPSHAHQIYSYPEHPHGDDDVILSIAEVSALTRACTSTLRYWRHIGTGPASFKMGRNVRYWLSDVLDWIKATYDNTHRAAPTDNRNGHPAGVPSHPAAH